MSESEDVVITGCGVVSPLGVGVDALRAGLLRGEGAVADLRFGDGPVWRGAAIPEFDPKQYVRPRKSLKVMCREIQLAFAAADMAWRDAAMDEANAPPERVGVTFGADVMYGETSEMADAAQHCLVDGEFDMRHWGSEGMAEIFPLWLLKYLPNMAACQIGIAIDARGPNNTLVTADTAGLQAVVEATETIRRGHADVMIAGGVGGRLHPSVLVMRRGSHVVPASAPFATDAVCRPFDRRRCGTVPGEGAAALVLERRRHAAARGRRALGVVRGQIVGFESVDSAGVGSGVCVERLVRRLLETASCSQSDLSHINANGLGTAPHDRVEGRALHAAAPGVPLASLKGAIGALGAGAGAVELAASLTLLQLRKTPSTRNCDDPDPECGAEILTGEPRAAAQECFVKVSTALTGQTAAVLVSAT